MDAKRKSADGYKKSSRNKKQYLAGRGKGNTSTGHWSQQKDSTPLNGGIRGVLFTCDTNRDDMCTREALNLLEDCASNMYPDKVDELKTEVESNQQQQQAAGSAAKTGIEAELERERKAIQNVTRKMFSTVKTGQRGLIFIRFLAEWLQPSDMTETILGEALKTKSLRTKYCIKIIPVDKTCFTSIDAIVKAVKPLITAYLPDDGESKTYAVELRSRSNNTLERDDVIDKIADLVPEHHKVDLSNPSVAILVEIMTNSVCLGMTSKFVELKKFNLFSCIESEAELERKRKIDAERREAAQKRKEQQQPPSQQPPSNN